MKDDPKKQDLALKLGRLSYTTNLENEKTFVSISLKAGKKQGDIFHLIVCTEKDAQFLMEEEGTEGL